MRARWVNAPEGPTSEAAPKNGPLLTWTEIRLTKKSACRGESSGRKAEKGMTTGSTANADPV